MDPKGHMVVDQARDDQLALGPDPFLDFALIATPNKGNSISVISDLTVGNHHVFPIFVTNYGSAINKYGHKDFFSDSKANSSYNGISVALPGYTKNRLRPKPSGVILACFDSVRQYYDNMFCHFERSEKSSIKPVKGSRAKK
jgi:hypothetical protein